MKKLTFLFIFALFSASFFSMSAAPAVAFTKTECENPVAQGGKGGACRSACNNAGGRQIETNVGPCTVSSRAGQQPAGVCCVLNAAANNQPAGGGTGTPSGGGGAGTPSGGGGTGTPTGSGSLGSAGGTLTVNFPNPLKFQTVEAMLDNVMTALRNMVAILALVFIVIGAILYITSGGNEARIKTAKAAITAALIGLALVLAAPAFLKEVYNAIGGTTTLPSQVSGAPTLTEIAGNVLTFLLGIIGVLAIIMLLVGSVMYLTAAGDEKRAESGKSTVKFAIIGIIVAFAALVLVTQVANFFNPIVP